MLSYSIMFDGESAIKSNSLVLQTVFFWFEFVEEVYLQAEEILTLGAVTSQ